MQDMAENCYIDSNATSIPRIILSAKRMLVQKDFDWRRLGSRDTKINEALVDFSGEATGDSDGEDDPAIGDKMADVDQMLGIESGAEMLPEAEGMVAPEAQGVASVPR